MTILIKYDELKLNSHLLKQSAHILSSEGYFCFLCHLGQSFTRIYLQAILCDYHCSDGNHCCWGVMAKPWLGCAGEAAWPVPDVSRAPPASWDSTWESWWIISNNVALNRIMKSSQKPSPQASSPHFTNTCLLSGMILGTRIQGPVSQQSLMPKDSYPASFNSSS